MKKRVLITFLALVMVMGMLMPTAFSAVVGTLPYSVSTTSVDMSAAGTGTLVINVPNPDPSRAYAGVEFLVQLSTDVKITSISCNLSGASTELKETNTPGVYGFACFALTNQFTGNLACTVNLAYKDSTVKTNATLIIQTVTQYVVTGHSRDDWASDGTKEIKLVPNSGALSSNANLSELSISPGTLDKKFEENTTEYSANVASTVSSVNIFATKAHDGAKVEGDGKKTLSEGTDTFTFQVKVTAENNVTTKIYTITVKRATPNSDSDAILTSLSISPGALNESFSSDKDTYTADVGNSVDRVTVYATANDGAKVSGAGAHQLVVGSNTITITVTSNDGKIVIPYFIKIKRAERGPTTTSPTVEVEPPEIPLALFPFVDVTENDWFYQNVYYCWINELINGTTDTTFSPYTAITRGMVVTILYRAENEPSTDELDNPFSDVADGLWYTNAIKWAADNGVVQGYTDGTYGPNKNVSRQELAAILGRYAGTELPQAREYTGFADDASIAEYAKDYVKALYRAEIINGKDNNRFDPLGTATRAEFAAMIHRFLTLEEA